MEGVKMSIHMFSLKVLLFTQNNVLIAGVISNYVLIKVPSVFSPQKRESATPLPVRIKFLLWRVPLGLSSFRW